MASRLRKGKQGTDRARAEARRKVGRPLARRRRSGVIREEYRRPANLMTLADCRKLERVLPPAAMDESLYWWLVEKQLTLLAAGRRRANSSGRTRSAAMQ